jgi:16S rRNA (guanine527-N7)-methyltransferase
MTPETAGQDPIDGRLNRLLASSGQSELPVELAARFDNYLRLLQRWNARTNLTAIRDVDGILRRHFLESIAVARALPAEIRTLLDFGSGAGFPGIPIALCRTEIAVTLAESQHKKAAFLREAARVLELPLQVHAARAETLSQAFDCVTLRAVDRMGDAIRSAVRLVRPSGWLAPLTTNAEWPGIQAIPGPAFVWRPPVQLPGSEDRILVLGSRAGPGTEAPGLDL